MELLLYHKPITNFKYPNQGGQVGEGMSKI